MTTQQATSNLLQSNSTNINGISVDVLRNVAHRLNKTITIYNSGLRGKRWLAAQGVGQSKMSFYFDLAWEIEIALAD